MATTQTTPQQAIIEKPQDGTATKEYVAHLKSSLKRYFKDFLKEAARADLAFMQDTLCNWDSSLNGREEYLDLAEAFAGTLGHWDVEFMRVPKKHSKAVRAYIAALEKGEVIQMPPAAAGKPEAAAPAGAGIHLPRTIRLNEDERAQVARLVRLLREDYWLSHFVKVLLRADGENPKLVTIEQAKDYLNSEAAVEDWVGKVQQYKDGWWGDHPAIKAVKEEWDEIDEYRSNRRIRQLIESAANAARRGTEKT